MPLVALGALAVGGSIVGGVMANKGANAQAKAVQDSSAAAVAEQRRQYDQDRADLAPWRESGTAANQRLAYLLGTAPKDASWVQDLSHDTAANGEYGSLMRDFTLNDFQKDPNYEFALGEGAKALQRSAAAKGNLFSGGTLKGLTRYNQDFASNQIDKARANFDNSRLTRYNLLAGLSQGGQQATNSTVQSGDRAASNISQITVNAGEQVGNARASGYAGWGNAINGGVNNAMSLYYLNKIK